MTDFGFRKIVSLTRSSKAPKFSRTDCEIVLLESQNNIMYVLRMFQKKLPEFFFFRK